jgi:DNA-binding NarL/FixJ family response regulator
VASMPIVHTVAIQDRSRMYRESLRLLLEASSRLRIAETVEDEDSLHVLCHIEPVDAVIFEAGGVPWNVGGMLERLRADNADVVLVGNYPHEFRHHRKADHVTYVTRTSSSRVFLAALQGGDMGMGAETDADLALPRKATESLTQRELQVLSLISQGSTTTQIGERLGISIKTVENRRRALFTKLGVQNQSHAVTVAMRNGLLGSS